MSGFSGSNNVAVAVLRLKHHGIFLGQFEGQPEPVVLDFGSENKTHPVLRSLNTFVNGGICGSLRRRKYFRNKDS